MKDVIEEQRQALIEFVRCDDFRLVCAADMCAKVNEAFLKIAVEADFIISRLRGEAGMIELASGKMPHTAKLLKTMATLMRGYAARVEDSQAPAFNKIITLNGVDG